MSISPQKMAASVKREFTPTNMYNTAEKATVEFVDSAWKSTLHNLNLGFSLAAALAWNDAVKFMLDKHVNIKKARFYHFIYAGLVTLLATLVTMISHAIRPNMKSVQIQPVIGFGR
jgi:membrane protein CcdC involved in cytochrome C biogenesis